MGTLIEGLNSGKSIDEYSDILKTLSDKQISSAIDFSNIRSNKRANTKDTAKDIISNVSKNTAEVASMAADTAATELNTAANIKNTVSKEAKAVASDAVTTSTAKAAVSEGAATASTTALTGAEAGATAATTGLSTAFKGLLASLAPLAGIIAPIAALGVALTAFNAYQNHIDNITKSAQEGVDAINEHSSSLETQISRVKELRDSISSGDLSDEEEYSVKSELLSIQNELVETYGKQAEGINLVNGSLETQIGLMNQLSDTETTSWLNENQEAIDNATKEMERERTFKLGTFEADGSEASKEIEKLFDQYGIEEGQSGTAGVYESVLKFTGDASEAQETIDNFMSDVRGIVKKYGSTSLTDQLLSSSADALSKAEEITGEYEEIYRTAQMASMLNDGQKIDLSY